MMSEKQMNFRKDYRSRIAGWYNGYVHALVIYTIGLTALYLYSQHLSGVLWWEWLTIPIVVVICNMFEWFLHMHIMHRPQGNRGLRAIYIRHTLNHHQFFSDHEMRFRDQKDWRVTLFPPYAMVVFILMAIPGALLVGYVITANVGWLIMCSTTGMYLTYEFMHLALRHLLQELLVGLRLLETLEQKLHGFHRLQRGQHLAQHPDATQLPLINEQLLLAGARLVDVDGRKDPALHQFAIEVDLEVSGALELLEDHIIHPRTGVDQGGADDGQTTALLDVARCTEEPLGLL